MLQVWYIEFEIAPWPVGGIIHDFGARTCQRGCAYGLRPCVPPSSSAKIRIETHNAPKWMNNELSLERRQHLRRASVGAWENSMASEVYGMPSHGTSARAAGLDQHLPMARCSGGVRNATDPDPESQGTMSAPHPLLMMCARDCGCVLRGPNAGGNLEASARAAHVAHMGALGGGQSGCFIVGRHHRPDMRRSTATPTTVLSASQNVALHLEHG